MSRRYFLFSAPLLFPFLLTAAASTGVDTAHQRTARGHAKTLKHPIIAQHLDPRQVNDVRLRSLVGPRSFGAAVIRAEILLDRLKFSPGQIESSYQLNLKRAITAFQKVHGLDATGTVNSKTWDLINSDQPADETPPDSVDRHEASRASDIPDAIIRYTITEDDVAGPFTKLAKAASSEELLLKEADLPQLNYESPLEGLAEKFHVNPKLLTQLNPGKNFTTAGEEILAPNVLTPVPAKAASVVVNGSDHSVTARDSEGKILAFYPASVGSFHDPLPVGKWKILGKKFNPEFHYNPNLFWDSENKDVKATLPPGPKSPVGVVWISLSKEHYGIHGTPEPSAIGKTQSHGCIRLTNWDAEELANMVAPGTPAILEEK